VLTKTPLGATAAFINRAVEYIGDECLLWPYGKSSGYGELHIDGKPKGAHAVVCERVHGPAPRIGLEAAHSCGNRDCVNPRHLRWATRRQNAEDKILHGRSMRGELHPNAKLTRVRVREIRASPLSTRELAAQYGVRQITVRAIRRRWRWEWLP
jgi:hypothetical protein